MTSHPLASLPIPAIVNHLWQTTAVAAVVWALTFALRRIRAGLRFRLWLLASVKFLLPFSLLITAGQHLRPATMETAPARAIGSFMTHAVQPYQERSFPRASMDAEQRDATNSRTRLTEACFLLWALGACAVLASWLHTWISLQRTVHHATPYTSVSGISVLQTNGLLEPGVFGILRPVLLMPHDLLTRLSPQELETIFAHELCHVRRRDNLTAALHTLVCALFWFHPAVWLIRARLLDEREQACDESVVSSGQDAELYAQSILNVCKLYVEAPVSAMAGVTGGELKQRIVRIMTATASAELTFRGKLLIVSAALLVVSSPFAIGFFDITAAHAQAGVGHDAALNNAKFEVATVKLSKAGEPNSNFNVRVGSLNTQNIPLSYDLEFAYHSLQIQKHSL